MLVAERVDPDTGRVLVCWTDEEPGVTGPSDLREAAGRLAVKPNWRVYHTEEAA